MSVLFSQACPLETELPDTPNVTPLALGTKPRIPTVGMTVPVERHVGAAFIEPIHSDGAVVDVGCWLGHVTANLARRGHKAIECDPSPGSSLARQYLLVLRTIHKLALPDRFLVATRDDAPRLRTSPAVFGTVLAAW